MSEPTRRLPARPSLEQLRKQAKDLLRDAVAGAATAIDRFRAVDARVDPAAATLTDAQLVLAREYGFASWAKLVHHVESIRPTDVRPFERLAEDIAKAYSTGDASVIREINQRHSTSFVWDWEPKDMQRRLRTWFASDARTPALALTDAQLLVARQFGFDRWEELTASVSTNGPAQRSTTSSPFYRIRDDGTTLEVRGPVEDKGWDAIIEVIAELKLTGLHAGGRMTDAALARVSRIEGLQRLDMGGSTQLTDGGLRSLANCPQLRDLNLSGWDMQITDAGLEVLRHLRELRALALVMSPRLSDAGVSHAAGCDRLEDVNLMRTATGDGTLAALANKPNLRRLKAGSAVTPKGLALLHRYPAFTTWSGETPTYSLMEFEAGSTYLMLHPAAFANGGLESLVGLDGIFALNLYSMGPRPPAITAAGMKPLVELANLGWLGADPSDDAMTHVAAMPRLRMLMCQDTRATDAGFAALSRSRTIEYIWGRKCEHLTSAGFKALGAMASLRGLSVSCAKVDDAALSTLPSFPALRELMPMDVKDDGFRHVGACAKLEGLWCMYCQDTGDVATEHIAHLSSLATYYAGGTRITDRSLEILGRVPSLEDVSFWDCTGITDAGVAALSALPRLRRLTVEGSPSVSRAIGAQFAPTVRVTILG
jgi:hypothetical protein